MSAFDALMIDADDAIFEVLGESLVFPDLSPEPVQAAVDSQVGENEHGETYSYYSVLVAAADVPGVRKNMPVQYNGKHYSVAAIQPSGNSWELVIV